MSSVGGTARATGMAFLISIEGYLSGNDLYATEQNKITLFGFALKWLYSIEEKFAPFYA